MTTLIQLTTEEQRLSDDAKEFVRRNKSIITEKFASLEQYPSVAKPISLFMAGSPGAGKTEFSKRLISYFGESGAKMVRIDPDDIRDLLPGYNGHNSYIFQSPVSFAVEKLHDHVISKKRHFLLDGTFSNYAKAVFNIQRSLNHDRLVRAIYVYQDPLVAWQFTKKREVVEGRHVPKEAFIEQFFAAKDTVNNLKQHFADKLEVWLIEKDYQSNAIKRLEFNIDNIDSYVQINYSKDKLEEIL